MVVLCASSDAVTGRTRASIFFSSVLAEFLARFASLEGEVGSMLRLMRPGASSLIDASLVSVNNALASHELFLGLGVMDPSAASSTSSAEGDTGLPAMS